MLIENVMLIRIGQAALDLFRAQRVKLVGCPTDAAGMQVEQLEPLLQQHHPRLIYTIPNFQNSTGACLSLPRRRQLIALADRYNFATQTPQDIEEGIRRLGRALHREIADCSRTFACQSD